MTGVHIRRERRLSRKIIIGEINRYFPFLRPIINLARFLTFRTYCPGYPHSQASYSDGLWIDRKVTQDQEAIEEYLFQKDLPGKKILHVGVGSSHLAKRCAGIAGCLVDGITVMPREKSHADSLGLKNYTVFLMNKNDPETLVNLSGNYAFIVDNDIAAYACCKAHFEQMLKTYLRLLAPGGEILAGRVSIGYFDTGFPLPDFYLKKLSERYACLFVKTRSLVKITPPKGGF